MKPTKSFNPAFDPSFNPYVNHALDRQIGNGLGRLHPTLGALKSEVRRRNAMPLLTLVCLSSAVVGWNFG